MKLKQAINKYLDYIKIYRSNGTYRFYKGRLSRFFSYCNNENITLKQSINKVYDYVYMLKETNKNSSVNKDLISINQLFKYYNINQRFELFKNDSVRFKSFTTNELAKIMNYLKHLNIENQLIITLLLETGIRINELLNIKIKNINLKDKTILLTTTKNNKNRYVFYSKLTQSNLEKYIKTVGSNELLFSFTYSKVNGLFRRLRKLLNIKNLNAHMFRHYFATTLLKYGVDIYAVSLLLGHSSIKTTVKYLHYDFNDLK
ncbi:MAG TPA: tyrosine-type recombinase/integrase [Acholeplasmataceae bacterium]|nr:tyrosine-type recombinase/integrase [Acholeplasmataceae bacterium]